MDSLHGAVLAAGGDGAAATAAAAAAAAALRRGSSLRKKKSSEKVRSLDERARRELTRSRLDSLENDNYVEAAADEDDEDYEPAPLDAASGEEDAAASAARRPSGQGSAGAKRRRSAALVAAAAACGGGGGKKSASRRPNISRWNAHFAEIEWSTPHSANVPAYAAMAAPPPRASAPRALCSVCGRRCAYTCVRCGARFCGLRCQRVHADTRCLKFLA